MRILHIFTGMNYVYTEALIKLFYYNVPNVVHEFLICDRKDNVPVGIKEMELSKAKIHYLKKGIRTQVFEISKYLDLFDYSIYHFLPNDIFLHTYYYFNRKQQKKIIWRIWGADLYNWKKNGIQGLLFNSIRKHTRENIKYIVAEPMDIPEFKKQFGENVLFLNGPDPKGYDVDFLEKQKSTKDVSTINILVGHSAVKTLHHKEILEKLSVYKDKNICIILPLNYGDMDYGREIKEFAIEVFGEDKVIIMDKKLELDQYAQRLWECDLAIVHSERQIAMGNITMMLYMGKKIYLMKDSIMDNYYRKEEGLDIFDSCSIGKISYNELVRNIDGSRNKEFAKNEINIHSIAEVWKNTFNYLEGELK